MCNRLIAIYLDMLAFSSNWVNYSKTGKKKELKVLLNLRRTPTSLYTYQGQHSWYFTWPTDQINRFFKAGRYGTINVKQKCCCFCEIFLFQLCIYLTRNFYTKARGFCVKQIINCKSYVCTLENLQEFVIELQN